MMSKSLLLSLALLSFVLTSVHAESFDPTLEITSITVTEVEVPNPIVEPPVANNAIGDIITAIDGIIAVGNKIWTIVDASRPVVTTKFSPSVSVLPDIEGKNPALNQMANWSRPISRSYRVSLRDTTNAEVVGFTYNVYFQYNGSFKGKGKYITNLKVDASDIYASWFYNIDATSELAGVANVGTDEAPIASAVMQISYVVKIFGKAIMKIQKIYVDGLGNVQVN